MPGDSISRSAVLGIFRLHGSDWQTALKEVHALPGTLSVEEVWHRLEAAGVKLDICAYKPRDDMEGHMHTGCVCNPGHGPPLLAALTKLLEDTERQNGASIA
jgi:hypothetical protein